MAGDQDMFDAVVMADERFHGEGYREGYEEGSSLGMIEGRWHGTLHGAKVGSEIGCYQGFAFAWRGLLHGCATERDRKCERVLVALNGCRFIRDKSFEIPWEQIPSMLLTPSDESKKMKVLEALIRMIQKFPYDDPTYDKLHEDLDRIRGKFKQLCSLLNVQPDFKISAEGSGFSF